LKLQQGTRIQVTLVSEKRARVKILPSGPEKEVDEK